MNPRRRIAVDLTPLTNTSKMGGARVLVLELIRSLAALDSEFEYILLTSADSHDEMAVLESANISRVCVKAAQVDAPQTKLRQSIHLLVNTVLPAGVQRQVKNLYRRFFAGGGETSLLEDLQIDLLFCPFTGPIYHTPGIPTVSVVYDLQFLQFPEYFSSVELMYLKEHFSEACALSEKLITGSHFVKQTIVENSRVNADDISVIYDTVHSRLAGALAPDKDLIKGFGLTAEAYLFYPARYWPHKNHQTGLSAFRQYLAQGGRRLKLVFSGIGELGKAELQRTAVEMGLADDVVLLSWVEENELAALFQYCLAVFFPSQYEGFGIPILEAFQFDRPVLCSDAGSLPEVAGEGALYFNPTSIDAISSAITRLVETPGLAAELVEKGRVQLEKFSDGRGMAAQYETVFAEVLKNG